MPRSQTFGYNAVAGIHELVVDRLLGADYDDGKIPDVFDGTFFHEESNVSIQVCVLLDKPSLTLDAPAGMDQYMELVLGLHVVVNFLGTPPLPFLNQEEQFKATVSLPLKLIVDPLTSEVKPDLGSVDPETISITADPNVDALRRAFIQSQFPQWVPTLLSNLSGKFKVPIALDAKRLVSDTFDLALIDDISGNDVDTVNFLFYSKLYPSTKGNPNGVLNFLEKDKTFTFMLSRAVFDQLLANFLDRRFARFNVTVGKSSVTKENVVFSAPDPSGIITIEGQKTSDHSGVRGKIHNATQGGKVSFSSKDDGTFKVTLAAKIGDVLEIRGDKIEFSGGGNSALLNYKPSISLSNGYISFNGNGSAEIVGIEMDVNVEGKVYLSVDPVTGKIIADARDIELDIPWWADMILGITTCGLAGLIISMYEDPIGQDIARLFNQSNSNMVPAFKNQKNMVIFYESITVKKNAIVLSGQIEAGFIHGAGRSDQTSVYLDANEKNSIGQTFELFSSNRFVCTDPGWMKQFAEYGLVRLGKVNFETLAYEDLATKSYTSDVVKIPGTGSLAGEVFAVKTAWNRYAKVRIDQTKTGSNILRWVTYKTPRGSEVTIEGKWLSDMKISQGSSGMISYIVKKYWGTFTLSFHRIYSDGPVKVKWTYTGPGDFKILNNDQRKVHIVVDIDKLGIQIGFSGTLEVEVEDIFGRKATDIIDLSGTASYGEPGPGMRQYIDPVTLAILMHGPAPISRAAERDKLIKQLNVIVQLYQEAIQRIGAPQARLPNTEVARYPLESPAPLSNEALGAFSEIKKPFQKEKLK